MIGPPSGVSIWLACGVTDLRNGFDGLAAIGQTKLSEHVYSGQLFAFRGRRGDRIKLLIESLQRLVIEQRAALLSRDVEIEKLKIELARLKRTQFGRSSEKRDQRMAQLELSLEDPEAADADL